MYQRRYAIYGALFGLAFPIIATFTEALTRYGSLARVREAQSSPLLWIIDSAVLWLGLFAALVGRRQDQIIAMEAARRESYLRTASDLFHAAQALLSNVSSFSSMSAETAASVRETTATMTQLSQTATRAALTAETVIGLATSAKQCSDDGLHAVEASTTELVALADEVRGLSSRIEGLNGRMRDILEIASVVNYVAERSQRLAESASRDVDRGGAAGLAGVVGEIRHHAEDAQQAAAQVKKILAEAHREMVTAMTAAEAGIRRAEEGARVASGTGDTIRRLASALRESSQAAREIATVAQQQDHGIEQVLKAMNEIYLAAEETMTSTHQVAQEARVLNDLASGLRKAVNS